MSETRSRAEQLKLELGSAIFMTFLGPLSASMYFRRKWEGGGDPRTIVYGLVGTILWTQAIVFLARAGGIL